MAVIVSKDPTQVSCYVDQRKHVAVYDVRAPAIDMLRAAILNSDWSAVYLTDEVTEKCGLFLKQCKVVIECYVPVKIVSIGPRYPDFITPLI
jgi:hypothetical protein